MALAHGSILLLWSGKQWRMSRSCSKGYCPYQIVSVKIPRSPLYVISLVRKFLNKLLTFSILSLNSLWVFNSNNLRTNNHKRILHISMALTHSSILLLWSGKQWRMSRSCSKGYCPYQIVSVKIPRSSKFL